MEMRDALEYGVQMANEIEGIIADIWQELLNIKNVGINDSFFDLGGHSLLLAKMLRKFDVLFPE